MTAENPTVESQIGQWRGYIERRAAISTADVDEMEDHLRDQISDLNAAGLHDDEAFLVAVKRMGDIDSISREFAREHSERLWKQLVLLPTDAEGGGASRRELAVVVGAAVGAAMATKAGSSLLGDEFARYAAVFVLPFLVGYFAWKRRMALRVTAVLGAVFVAAAVLQSVYPFDSGGATEAIAAIHTPIVLWFAVGVAYAGGRWRDARRRMDFIRFTGEWVVYLTLLGLGGGVLTALTVGAFDALGSDIESVVEDWIVPCVAPAGVLVAAWLVEAKQSVVENIAPVLTRVFTPLTTVMLLALLGAFAVSGRFVDVDRTLLILMDVILVLVLGLLLYAVSARDPHLRPDFFDRMQLMLVLSALAVDVLMLIAMLTRIAEFGTSANKVTALGLNLVLLTNLAWSAHLLGGFLRRRRDFAAIERWQTGYLPVFGVWAALVAVTVPPAFDFV